MIWWGFIVACKVSSRRMVRAVIETLPRQLILALQHHVVGGRVRARAHEGVLPRRAVNGGGLEQLPTVKDRLGIDPWGVAARRARLEQDMRRDVGRQAADPTED